MPVRTFSLFVALGILVGAAVFLRFARSRGLDTRPLEGLAWRVVVLGLVGSRLLYVVTHLGEGASPRGVRGVGGVVHNTAIYEILLLVPLVVVLCSLARRRARDGWITATFLLWYGLQRFATPAPEPVSGPGVRARAGDEAASEGWTSPGPCAVRATSEPRRRPAYPSSAGRPPMVEPPWPNPTTAPNDGGLGSTEGSGSRGGI